MSNVNLRKKYVCVSESENERRRSFKFEHIQKVFDEFACPTMMVTAPHVAFCFQIF